MHCMPVLDRPDLPLFGRTPRPCSSDGVRRQRQRRLLACGSFNAVNGRLPSDAWILVASSAVTLKHTEDPVSDMYATHRIEPS